MAKNKVRLDEPLSARKWNTMQDDIAANQDKLRKLSAQLKKGGMTGEPAQKVRVVNRSGYDASRYDIMGIEGQAYIANDQALLDRVLEIDIVNAETHAYKWVILAEAIPNGGVGFAYISGSVLCKVDFQTDGDGWANPETDDNFKLKSDASSGEARVLWQVAGTGEQWAIVHFPFKVAAAAAISFSAMGGAYELDSSTPYSGQLLQASYSPAGPSTAVDRRTFLKLPSPVNAASISNVFLKADHMPGFSLNYKHVADANFVPFDCTCSCLVTLYPITEDVEDYSLIDWDDMPTLGTPYNGGGFWKFLDSLDLTFTGSPNFQKINISNRMQNDIAGTNGQDWGVNVLMGLPPIFSALETAYGICVELIPFASSMGTPGGGSRSARHVWRIDGTPGSHYIETN